MINVKNIAYSNLSLKASTYSPEVQHVHQDGNVDEVYPPADVAVPQHDQALAEFQAGLLRQAQSPVGL